MDLQQYIRDTLAKGKEIYTPLQNALQSVGNTVGGYAQSQIDNQRATNPVNRLLLDQFVQDPNSHKPFPVLQKHISQAAQAQQLLENSNRSPQDRQKYIDYISNIDNSPLVMGMAMGGDSVGGDKIMAADNAKSLIHPLDQSVEQLAESAGGWKPGMRQQFDTALYSKDADTLKKLLPDVPHEYAQRFAKNIQDIVGAPPIHPEDQQAMTNYIDSVRLKQPDPALHVDALNIADHYGIPMPKTPNGIANVFDNALATLRSKK